MKRPRARAGVRLEATIGWHWAKRTLWWVPAVSWLLGGIAGYVVGVSL